MKRVLLIVAAAALAAPAFANEVILCSDVPGCNNLEMKNHYERKQLEASYELKLRGVQLEMRELELKHEVDKQKLYVVIEELKVKRVVQEQTARAISEGQLTPRQVEEYQQLLIEKERAKAVQHMKELTAKAEAQIEQAKADRDEFIAKIWEQARRCLDGIGPCDNKPQVPQ